MIRVITLIVEEDHGSVHIGRVMPDGTVDENAAVGIDYEDAFSRLGDALDKERPERDW